MPAALLDHICIKRHKLDARGMLQKLVYCRVSMTADLDKYAGRIVCGSSILVCTACPVRLVSAGEHSDSKVFAVQLVIFSNVYGGFVLLQLCKEGPQYSIDGGAAILERQALVRKDSCYAGPRL